MKTIEVTAEGGSTVTGPARLRLSWAQFHARLELGLRWPRGEFVSLPAGRELTFDRGETLAIEDPASVTPDTFRPIGWTLPKPPRPAKTEG